MTQEPRPAYHRRNDLKRLREASKDTPLVVSDTGRHYEVRVAGNVLLAGRHEVIAAYIAGFTNACDLNGQLRSESDEITELRLDVKMLSERLRAVTVAILDNHDWEGTVLDACEAMNQKIAATNAWIEAMKDLASRMLDMLERVEWIRATGGTHFVCAFCHAVSDRDDGPGHTEDCEWQRVVREGNQLRLDKVLR